MAVTVAKARSGVYQQIYQIVNQAANIALGVDKISIQNSGDLVAVGSKILSRDDLTVQFANFLVGRIGKTIIEAKAYRSKYSFLMHDDFEWGAVVQKIEADMPEAVSDASLDLEDGKSVDMYIVSKPKGVMKFYWKQGVNTFFVTIQRKWLKDAFVGAAQMGAFLKALEIQVRNKLELANENMGQLTLANLAGQCYGTALEIRTGSMYVMETGNSLPSDPLQMLHNPDYLRYLSETFQNVSVDLTSLTEMWNLEGRPKFTDASDQQLVVPSRLVNAMRTNVEWNAFHADRVALGQNHVIPHWISPKDPYKVMVRVDKNMDDDNPAYQDVEIDCLLGIMFDKKAAGTYRHNEEVATTPYNARGRYTNTFWHEDNLWFNDLGEQAVIFTTR